MITLRGAEPPFLKLSHSLSVVAYNKALHKCIVVGARAGPATVFIEY